MVMAKVRAALVLSLALVLVPAALAAPVSQQRTTGALPTRGVLIVGKSLAGLTLGATQATVKKRWGSRYVNCTKAPCDDPTWLYFYPSGEPVGAGVRFRNNKAVAIFTLGATPGWKSTEGIKVADPISNLYDLYGTPKYTKFIGYEAYSLTRNGVTTSFYSTSGVIYGFAITAPGVTVCQ
jgi:hypothetical protein